jgi:polysaccharide export outer membrane protein
VNRTTCRKRAGVSSFRARRPRAWRFAATAVCLGVLLGPPLVAQEPAAIEEADEQPYRIGPGDQLELFVWKEPDLTRQLLVRTDGMVTVPLIGDVEAGGFTTSDVATSIEERLGQYVNSPNVTVGLKTGQSAQFFVVGKVSKPGAYPLDKPTNFLQALALAGGFVEFAKTDRVLIYREGESKVHTVNYEKLEDGEDPSENIPLYPGDTVLVP